jgi:hypothetical protein
MPAVDHGDDLTAWLPASELHEHLPSPLGDLLVAFGRSWQQRSEGANAEGNAKVHTQQLHGTSARSIRHIHLRALVLTK